MKHKHIAITLAITAFGIGLSGCANTNPPPKSEPQTRYSVTQTEWENNIDSLSPWRKDQVVNAKNTPQSYALTSAESPVLPTSYKAEICIIEDEIKTPFFDMLIDGTYIAGMQRIDTDEGAMTIDTIENGVYYNYSNQVYDYDRNCYTSGPWKRRPSDKKTYFACAQFGDLVYYLKDKYSLFTYSESEKAYTCAKCDGDTSSKDDNVLKNINIKFENGTLTHLSVAEWHFENKVFTYEAKDINKTTVTLPTDFTEIPAP